jgi:hypothetical protein
MATAIAAATVIAKTCMYVHEQDRQALRETSEMAESERLSGSGGARVGGAMLKEREDEDEDEGAPVGWVLFIYIYRWIDIDIDISVKRKKADGERERERERESGK